MRMGRKGRGLRRLLRVFALLCLASTAEGASRCAERSAMAGTFLQPTEALVARDDAAWDALFGEIAALGMKDVYLQWSAADGVYEEGVIRWPRSPAALAKRVLDVAAKHGLRAWIGLSYTDAWWQRIERSRSLESVTVYLRRRLFVNEAAARDVAPVAVAHQAFAGWYVTEEIDDKNWLEPARRAAIAEYAGALARSLRALAPERPIAISGFATGFASPGTLASLWTSILEKGPIDVVLLQDGIGAGHLDEPELAMVLPSLRNAVTAAGRQLGMVVELFAVNEPAVNATAVKSEATENETAEPKWSARPATLARIERQIALARRFATGPLVAFSVPDYMSPFAGGNAARLYSEYRARVLRCPSR